MHGIPRVIRSETIEFARIKAKLLSEWRDMNLSKRSEFCKDAGLPQISIEKHSITIEALPWINRAARRSV